MLHTIKETISSLDNIAQSKELCMNRFNRYQLFLMIEKENEKIEIAFEFEFSRDCVIKILQFNWLSY